VYDRKVGKGQEDGPMRVRQKKKKKAYPWGEKVTLRQKRQTEDHIEGGGKRRKKSGVETKRRKATAAKSTGKNQKGGKKITTRRGWGITIENHFKTAN